MLRDYVIQYFPNIMITGTIKVVYNEGVTEFGYLNLELLGLMGIFLPFNMYYSKAKEVTKSK